MKKFIKYLLLIFLFSIWGIILTNKEQTHEAVRQTKKEINDIINKPCEKPLKYSIGNIDEKFNISQEELIKLTEEAADIWNKAVGKDILKYDPSAKFKINLVFDERQKQTVETEKLEENLKSLDMSREILTKQYESLQSSYDKKIKVYKKDLERYKDKLNKYNEAVEYWNEKGGAPSEEFEDLEDERKDLEDLYDDLKSQQKEINKLTGKSNNLAGQESKIINQYNSNLTTYKNKYGNAHEFEKGIFDGKEINIYQFRKMSDLKLTLAHEMGHYLGIGHTENPASIMYYLIGDQDIENIAPTQEDLAEIKIICGLN